MAVARGITSPTRRAWPEFRVAVDGVLAVPLTFSMGILRGYSPFIALPYSKMFTKVHFPIPPHGTAGIRDKA